MKTPALALAVAGFAAAFTIAGAAPANATDTCPRWRCGFNGTSLNGISLNGRTFNGMRLNGYRWNGVSASGADDATAAPTVKAVRLPAGKRLTNR